MKKRGFKKPTRTARINWTIDIRALNLLELASKHNGHSMSKIVSELVLQKLSDPVKRIKEEVRDLAKQINLKQEKLKELQSDLK